MITQFHSYQSVRSRQFQRIGGQFAIKNFIREANGVAKVAVLIGVVIVAAVVAVIAYIYWPRSLGMRARFFPEEGGTIEITGGDGCVFTLSLPPYALVNEEEISLTPLDDIEGFPLASGIVAAVQMEPDGLRLMCPANLTIELPSPVPDDLVGFLVQSNGEGFHLYPIEVNGNEFSFKLMHFTVAGGTTVSCEDLKALDVSTWLTQEDRAMQRIAILRAEVERCSPEGFDTDEIASALMEIHYDWFFDPGTPWGVQRILMEAQSDPEGFLMRATSELNSWYQSLMFDDYFLDFTPFMEYAPDLVPLPSPIDCGHPDGFPCYNLDAVAEAASAKLFEAFKRAVTRANDRCVSGGQNLDEEALGLIRKASWLACEDHWSLYKKYFDVDKLVALKTCGIWSLEIEPSSETIKTDETLQLKALAKDKQGNMIRELGPTEVNWYSFDVPVATIDEYGLVTAVDEGTARIRARILAHCWPLYLAEAQITVESEVASVVIAPEEATISVDQTLTLNVTVYDKDGNELKGYPIEWTIPPGGIVAFDPATQTVTGVSPGTAQITATCDGKSASATITVATEVKYRLTWKATVGYCLEYDYITGVSALSQWWNRWSEDRVFEGYAVIEEGSDSTGNTTYEVTDFWANGHYELHSVVWDADGSPSLDSEVRWKEVIYDITENGKDLVKQRIEDNFQVLRYPNGSFMKTPNPTREYFFPYGYPFNYERYEALKKTREKEVVNPNSTHYSEYTIYDSPYREYVTDFPWLFQCRGIATESEPKFIEYDETTQTFHLEIEQGAIGLYFGLCGSERFTIVYANHSRCVSGCEVGSCNGFHVIAYWEINVEVIHEEASYSSSQSNNNNLPASIDASTGEIGLATSFDHTSILTTMFVAATVYLAMRKPIYFVRRRTKSETAGRVHNFGKTA